MKTNIVAVLALFCSFNLQAYSNFIENPYTPYPPGCATLPDLQTALHGDNVVKFFEQVIPLEDGLLTTMVDALVTAYRVVCADANRSVIWLAFNAPEGVTGTQYYSTPEVRAVIGEAGYYVVSLEREPNSWDLGNHPWQYSQVFGYRDDWFFGGGDSHDRTWIFVLDATAPINDSFGAGSAISPAQYNGSFKLELNWRDESTKHVIEVPSTASIFASIPRIPLSGRLSGNWVVDGASDQGFVIAISEVVPDSAPETASELLGSPLLMFLSWLTFDQNGHQLWLTGAAEFAIGATEVTIPIESVSNGEFLGSKSADRTTIGSVIITGNSCNDLTLEYDLDMYGIGTGLGSGTKRLQRLFSLETAGYVCRDLQARILAK